MKALLSMYRLRFATTLTYMLQSTEYRVGPYLKWFWRTQDFDVVMRRRTLDPTQPARLLRFGLSSGMFLQFSVGFALLVQWMWQGYRPGWQFGLALILSSPIVWAHLIVLPLVVGRWLFITPRQKHAVAASAKIYREHPGVKVAIIGSYGKTTMKELLKTVLGEAKKVAATEANRNVATAHARFAKSLDGDEDIVLMEYGEAKPGDIARFAKQTAPTHAVVTGLAPAHLDQYRTLDRAAKDLFSIGGYVAAGHTYVNTDSKAIAPFIGKGMQKFNHSTALRWKVEDVVVEPQAGGVSFALVKGKRRLQLHSGLLGRHNVAPLAFAAGFALQQGLTEQQVIDGVAKTQPFEHRMQPLWINGALVIDDTYNGNLEGVRAGTALLADMAAERKWYVTPGLVEQGHDTAKIHHQLGEMIAHAKPDVVVLMANSVQPYIEAGLVVGNYQGELRIEHDPLEFYANLPHFLAVGDVMLMQNDWTDNYY